MSGQELKRIAASIGVTPEFVCVEAGISSETLYKVYRDERVRATTRSKVEQAILRLAAKAKAVAV